MSATSERDRAIALAKFRPHDALIQARKVVEPWFRAQALSWVARFTDGDPVAVAAEAAKAARDGGDNYQKCAVRAWEIAALAERVCTFEARKCLSECLFLVQTVEPISSRSEALLLLLQASVKITHQDAEEVHELLKTLCQSEEHWRVKRALRDGARIISGELQPRPFFW
ncbi:MAG: hypothetical protein V4724_03590 [Pseudomonadota bacterium]